MSEHSDTEHRIKVKLFYQTTLTSGKLDALRFAYEVAGNIDAIKRELQVVEDRLLHADQTTGPMKPGAGPRIYQEGYRAGLHEAIALITGLTTDATTAD